MISIEDRGVFPSAEQGQRRKVTKFSNLTVLFVVFSRTDRCCHGRLCQIHESPTPPQVMLHRVTIDVHTLLLCSTYAKTTFLVTFVTSLAYHQGYIILQLCTLYRIPGMYPRGSDRGGGTCVVYGGMWDSPHLVLYVPHISTNDLDSISM